MKAKTKYLVIALALSLICMAIGSFAWLTSTFNVNSNLKITTGTLNFVIEDESWMLETSNKTEFINKDFNSIKKLKEGDSLLKEITIRNTGTLKQKLILKENNNLPKEFSDIFEIIIFDQIYVLDEMITEPNQTRNMVIKLILKTPQTGNKDEYISIDFSKLKNVSFGTIDVTQVN